MPEPPAHPTPGVTTRVPRRVAFGIGTAQLLVWGSSFYLLAILGAPIATDTGWEPGWIAAGLSIGLVAAGLVSRRVGRMIDARGGRRVLAGSGVLAALALLVIALAPSLPVYLLGWTVMGLGMGLGLYDPAFATLGRLYGTSARPAITQVTLVAGFASTVSWPVTAALTDAVGWRGACLAWALVDLAIVAPLYLLLVPDPADTREVSGVPPSERRSEERLDRTFVLLAAVVAGGALIMTVIATVLVDLLHAGGIPAAVAVAIGALLGPSQVGARLLETLAGARHHPLVTMLISGLLVLAGLGILLGVLVLAPGAAIVAALGVIAYGAGSGLRTIARGTVPLALYGPRRYPVVMGRLAAPALIGQAVAPVIGAVLITRIGPAGTASVLTVAAGLTLLPVLGLRRVASRDQAEG